MTRMTPNTSDSPEAIRNRNIAVVSPPMNWLNRNEAATAISLRSLRATRAVRARAPLADASSVRREGGGQQLGILHDRERTARVLDHHAPIFRGEGLVRFLAEGALADRRVEAHPEHRLRYCVGFGAVGLLHPFGERVDRLVADDRPSGGILRFGEFLQILD